MLNGKHGGNDLAHDIKLDFSANLNPLGMPESVREAVIASVSDCERYPDPKCSRLREKFSEMHRVPNEKIVFGNGADDLIYRIVSALKPKRALICAPTFSEYRKALSEHGCEVREHILTADSGFELNRSILPEISGNDMVFVCNPNNPTGKLTPPELMAEIAEKCRKTGAYLLCDESFIEFVENSEKLTLLGRMNEKTLILRSFTKIYAMAGIRLGCVVCGDAEISRKIEDSGQYWSTSATAQAAGYAALDERDYVSQTVGYVRREREFLAAELKKHGFEVYESAADYIFFRAENRLGERLLREGILIRSCADYSGLDGSYFRIAVRTSDENRRFAAVLGRLMNG